MMVLLAVILMDLLTGMEFDLFVPSNGQGAARSDSRLKNYHQQRHHTHSNIFNQRDHGHRDFKHHA